VALAHALESAGKEMSTAMENPKLGTMISVMGDACKGSVEAHGSALRSLHPFHATVTWLLSPSTATAE
jgi:dihydroxyacetone kinase-like predicted kinase